jgi:hypothetical protein
VFGHAGISHKITVEISDEAYGYLARIAKLEDVALEKLLSDYLASGLYSMIREYAELQDLTVPQLQAKLAEISL